MNVSSPRFQWILPRLFAVFSLVLLAFYVLDPIFHFRQSAGSLDFIQYWSAHQLAAHGRNPYDLKNLFTVQLELRHDLQMPVAMWNPPFVLLLLYPLLRLSYHQAIVGFALLNVAMLFVAALLFWRWRYRLRSSQLELFWAIPAAAIYYPAIQCIQVGQLSLLVTLALAMSLTAISRGNDFFAGVFLSIAFLKPYLLYLLWVYLFFWALREKRFALFGGLLSALILLASSTELLFPGLWGFWWQAISQPSAQSAAPNIFEWLPATVISPLRMFLAHGSPMMPVWPVVVVPAVAMLMLCWKLVRTKRFILVDSLPIVVCWSIFTAPYGWLFDQSILLLTYLALIFTVASLGGKSRILLFSCLIIPQFLLWWLPGRVIHYQHQFFWFPGVLLATWYLAQREAKRIESND